MRSPYRRAVGIGLLIGYAALLGAVVTANRSPATGYELSLYAATPQPVWVGLAVAGVAGLCVALATAGGSRYRSAGLTLVGAVGVSVAAMPVLRGYRYYGAGDALTHLGWARELAAGALSPTELLYPGVHSVAVVVSSVAGVPLTRGMEYIALVAFPLVFLLVVPLVVRLVADARYAYPVGLAAALLFAPINNISVHPAPHPASQAILFLPVPVFLALTYAFDRSAGSVAAAVPSEGPVERPDDADSDRASRRTVTDGSGLVPVGITGIGALLAIISVAVVLFHPQQALNVALVFVAVTVLQLLYRRRNPDHEIAGHRWLGLQTGVIAVALAVWIPRFERARDAISFTAVSVFGGDAAAGTVVASKATSITAVGGSLVGVFFKLFLAGAVLSLAAAVVIFATASGRVGDGWLDAGVRYLAATLAPLGLVFAIVLVAGAGDMYFRYQGFIMVILTMLGAVGIALAVDRFDASVKPGTGRVLALVALLVLSPVAAMGFHTSPYMYQPTPHVTESQLDGYTASFDHRGGEVEFMGLRGGPERYVDYYYGSERARTTLEFPGYSDATTSAVFNQGAYASTYGGPRYLAVTQSSYEREVVLYGGYRYTQRGFERLETAPTVNRVRTNAAFSLYYVDGAEEASDSGGAD